MLVIETGKPGAYIDYTLLIYHLANTPIDTCTANAVQLMLHLLLSAKPYFLLILTHLD